MRLHELRLRAFGPYAAEQVVDFGRLAASGLFLLEGPTGAGKTTILDAITFALYGGLAGESSGRDRLRSHFAPPDAEPWVMCEFSLRGVRWRVERVPEHSRPKKRGGGFTTEAARVHVQRLEAGAWVSLTSNKAEAGEIVTGAVGLNRDQFTQVMLLPQGEFARFLRCGDDERREVLTRLFGTGLYDRITAELDRRRAEAVKRQQESRRRIEGAVSAAAEAAGLDEDDRAGVLGLAGAERAVRLKELAAELAAEAVSSQAALTEAGARLAAATRADEEAKLAAGRMGRLVDALAKLREHEATRPEHERAEAALAAARRAEPVRPLLVGLAEALEAVEQARSALAGVTGAADPPVPAAPAPDRAGQLAREAAARAEQADREAAALQHLVDAESGLPGLRRDLEALEDAERRASAEAARVAERRAELPAEIARLEGEWRQARSEAAGLEAARVRLAALQQQQEAAARAGELTAQVDQARAAAQAAVDEHQAAVDEHQRRLDARIANMAAELAGTLADGEPCPVCGATDHPSPAAAHGGVVSAEDAAEAARRRDEAEARRRASQAEHAQLAQELAACLAVCQGRDSAGLDAELAGARDAIAAAGSAGQEAAALEAELATARAQLESGNDDLREAELAAAAARDQAAAARQALTALRAQLAGAAGGHPSVAGRQSALRQSAERDRALSGALDRYAAALAAWAAALGHAEREARASGFATVDDAGAAVLAPAGQAALEASVSEWKRVLAGLSSAVMAEDLAGLDPNQAEPIRRAAAQAATGLQAARDAEALARTARDAAAARSQRFAARLEEVRRAEEEHDALLESTEPVIRLAGLAKGVDGRKVALTTYVLRHWFSQVVAAANVRLARMSSGRYELKRTDRAETRRERAGLTLAVIDRHTGEERSPSSLSGGETFYTSLALALGLADVVKAEAGGVDLDTLFIDEGFGSLDADTLDQVMAVIDDLRDRGRVVGVVSHVADLKDRIPERLEVRRLPDGSSAARVVA